MDYEVGSIADLISGFHTPNRPRVHRRAVTPTKRPPLEEETPKTTPRERKKPHVLPVELTHENGKDQCHKRKHKFDPNTKEKVNKNKCDAVDHGMKKKKSKKLNGEKCSSEELGNREENIGNDGKKKKKRKNQENNEELDTRKLERNHSDETEGVEEPKKKKKKRKNAEKEAEMEKSESNPSDEIEGVEGKKKKKNKKPKDDNVLNHGKKRKSSQSNCQIDENKKKRKIENGGVENHGSDLANAEETSEGLTDFQKAAKRRIEKKNLKTEKFEDDEMKRTIFVGNIPVSILKGKYKKTLRKIFVPYGDIESIRIRNVPVADLLTKPKVAFIEKSFHPERSTVSAYIKFKNSSSVDKALVENNTKIENNHIRVDSCVGGNKPNTDSRKTLFLGNLPFNVEEEDIRKLFEKCGAISSVRVVRDKKTQIGKGFGFLNFEKNDGVELALAMQEEDLIIGKKIIRLNRYVASTPKNNEEKFMGNQIGQKNKNNDRSNRGFGKKRDGQGNKIRKRDFVGNSDQKVKKKKFNKSEDNEQHFEKSTKSRMPSDQSFKGVVATKKKKNKFNKNVLMKKKISKILTSH